jgi:hypothetical protein
LEQNARGRFRETLDPHRTFAFDWLARLSIPLIAATMAP